MENSHNTAEQVKPFADQLHAARAQVEAGAPTPEDFIQLQDLAGSITQLETGSFKGPDGRFVKAEDALLVVEAADPKHWILDEMDTHGLGLITGAKEFGDLPEGIKRDFNKSATGQLKELQDDANGRLVLSAHLSETQKAAHQDAQKSAHAKRETILNDKEHAELLAVRETAESTRKQELTPQIDDVVKAQGGDKVNQYYARKQAEESARKEAHEAGKAAAAARKETIDASGGAGHLESLRQKETLEAARVAKEAEREAFKQRIGVVNDDVTPLRSEPKSRKDSFDNDATKGDMNYGEWVAAGGQDAADKRYVAKVQDQRNVVRQTLGVEEPSADKSDKKITTEPKSPKYGFDTDPTRADMNYKEWLAAGGGKAAEKRASEQPEVTPEEGEVLRTIDLINNARRFRQEQREADAADADLTPAPTSAAKEAEWTPPAPRSTGSTEGRATEAENRRDPILVVEQENADNKSVEKLTPAEAHLEKCRTDIAAAYVKQRAGLISDETYNKYKAKYDKALQQILDRAKDSLQTEHGFDDLNKRVPFLERLRQEEQIQPEIDKRRQTEIDKTTVEIFNAAESQYLQMYADRSEVSGLVNPDGMKTQEKVDKAYQVLVDMFDTVGARAAQVLREFEPGISDTEIRARGAQANVDYLGTFYGERVKIIENQATPTGKLMKFWNKHAGAKLLGNAGFKQIPARLKEVATDKVTRREVAKTIGMRSLASAAIIGASTAGGAILMGPVGAVAGGLFARRFASRQALSMVDGRAGVDAGRKVKSASRDASEDALEATSRIVALDTDKPVTAKDMFAPGHEQLESKVRRNRTRTVGYTAIGLAGGAVVGKAVGFAKDVLFGGNGTESAVSAAEKIKAAAGQKTPPDSSGAVLPPAEGGGVAAADSAPASSVPANPGPTASAMTPEFQNLISTPEGSADFKQFETWMNKFVAENPTLDGATWDPANPNSPGSQAYIDKFNDQWDDYIELHKA